MRHIWQPYCLGLDELTPLELELEYSVRKLTIMAADTLAPSVARASAAALLTMQGVFHKDGFIDLCHHTSTNNRKNNIIFSYFFSKNSAQQQLVFSLLKTKMFLEIMGLK